MTKFRLPTYNPETGEMKTIRGLLPSVDSKGYFTLWVDGKLRRGHHVAWFLTYGYWPTKEIDHIDGNRLNNAIANLREATRSENECNKKKRKDNTSGVKGVYWNGKCWRVQVTFKKRTYTWSGFEDLELSELVAQEAREKYHGVFAHH